MLQRVKWQEISPRVKMLLPEFATIIDNLNPDHNHNLYLVNYPYGAAILDQGVFQIPNADNHLVPLNHSTIPQQIKNDLGYCGTIPLGLMLENSIETFMRADQRVIPSTMLTPGKFISLWRVLDEGISFHAGRFWNVCSGARSICMLPKITDANGYKAIKAKHGLKLKVPQKLIEHFELFSSIIQHIPTEIPWQSSLLFFPQHWFSHQKDGAWVKFYHYLLNTVWQGAAFRRNQFIFDFAFSRAQENRNLRSNPYLADTVRHLVAIGCGAVPAFTPAIDQTAAPIDLLQSVFVESYGLKRYAPTIMHLQHFSPQSQNPVYYSFQIPTTTVFSPKSRKVSSTMVELQEVKHIMEILLTEILKGNLEVENTPLFELAKNVHYEYFHSEKDKADEIQQASLIAELNPKFTHLGSGDGDYQFAEFAPFFRGCISISNNI